MARDYLDGYFKIKRFEETLKYNNKLTNRKLGIRLIK